MKKLVYLTALALPIAFAACNQDELSAFEQESNTQEVVDAVKGAKIVAHGMTVNLANDASTRLNANGWEQGDKIGIAWVTAWDDMLADEKLTANQIEALSFGEYTIFTPDQMGYRPANEIGDYAKITKKSGNYIYVSYGDDPASKRFSFASYNGQSQITDKLEVGNFIKVASWNVDAYKSTVDSYYYTIAPVTGIAQEQYPITWANFANVTDNKLYANNMFEYAGNSFGYDGDIYEGAYFAYWPFERLNTIKEKRFDLNNNQDVASAEQFYLKNAVAVSAIDSINARNVAGTFVTRENVSKQFSLVTVANAISVNTTFTGSENVDGMKIAKVELTTAGKNLFCTEASFNPHKLPVAVYTNGQYNSETTKAKMTKDQLFGTDKAFVMRTYKSTLTSEPAIDMPVNAANTFAMLTYPTANQTVTTDEVEVKLTVKEGNAEVGYYTIKYKDSDDSNSDNAQNNNALSKLAQLLNGGYSLNGKTYSLQNMNTVYFNIPLKLNMSMYTSTKDWVVNSADAWNSVVEAIDALNLTDATIKLNGNIAFTTVAPKFPKTAKLQVSGGTYTMTINKELSATINKDVKDLNFVVMSGATLTVAEGATVNGTIQVDGILNMNGKATGNINITKSAYHAGVVNLGAKGYISGNVTNGNVINVTEGTANKITGTVSGGKVIAIVTNGANAANINSNVKATDITFAGATVNNVYLNASITYTTTGATVFKGNLGSGDAVNLTVKDGTLTFADDAAFNTSGTVTINSGATMIVATGNNQITMSKVVNNGTVELQKSSKGKVTTWNAPEVTGSGSVVLNGNTHNKN